MKTYLSQWMWCAASIMCMVVIGAHQLTGQTTPTSVLSPPLVDEAGDSLCFQLYIYPISYQSSHLIRAKDVILTAECGGYKYDACDTALSILKGVLATVPRAVTPPYNGDVHGIFLIGNDSTKLVDTVEIRRPCRFFINGCAFQPPSDLRERLLDIVYRLDPSPQYFKVPYRRNLSP